MKKKLYCDNDYYYKEFTIKKLTDIVKPIREIFYSKRIKKIGIRTPELIKKKVFLKKLTLVVILKYKKIEGFKAFGKKCDVVDKNQLEVFCKQAFVIMSKLHNNNIRHGDLTARNFFIVNNEVGLCDFETTKKVPFGFMAMREAHHFFKYCKIHLGDTKSQKLYEEYLDSLNQCDLWKKLAKRHVFYKVNNCENINEIFNHEHLKI